MITLLLRGKYAGNLDETWQTKFNLLEMLIRNGEQIINLPETFCDKDVDNFIKSNLIYTFCHAMYRDNRQKTVLDFGCGIGNLVWALRFFGIQAYGFDISKEALKFCRVPEYCNYLNTKKLSYGNASFDLVYSREVLEHLSTEKDIFICLKESPKISKSLIKNIVGGVQ